MMMMMTTTMVMTMMMAVMVTSCGRLKEDDCWKGQEPLLKTWMKKSTEMIHEY